jgi:hypothetical protein
VPAGWIKIDDLWDPNRCGNPTMIDWNVFLIQRIDHRPVGTSLWVCSGSVPDSWEIIDRSWNPTTCGRPTAISNNTLHIRRVR